MWRLFSGIAVLVASLVGGGAVASLGSTESAAAPTSALIFNDPNSATRKDDISQALRTLINTADPGSTIRVAIYLFTDTATSDALVAARNRGVNVQVVHSDTDPSHIPSSVRDPLVQALGTDTSKPSFITHCNGSCIGSGGIMHNKLALFSSVAGTSVVFSTSANFKPNGSGDGRWNNAVQVAGNNALHAYFAGYFTDLKNKVKDSDYYHTRPPTSFGDYRSYFFPRSSGDPIVDVLNGVDCSQRNPNTGTKYGQTVVKVAISYFTRSAVARKLWEMDNAGCYVQVAYNQGNLHPDLKCYILDRSGPFNGIQSWYFPQGTVGIHSKYLTIEGYYGGYFDKKIVWTGSHSYTGPALRSNDETILRLRTAPMYDAFAANYHDIVNAPGAAYQESLPSHC